MYICENTTFESIFYSLKPLGKKTRGKASHQHVDAERQKILLQQLITLNSHIHTHKIPNDLKIISPN